jgi:hypothetical protein
MSACRWDRDAEDYLIDGKPCRTDDYGDPTRHCTARRTCSEHIGPDELTCPKCLGRTKVVVRRIVELAPLMPIQAVRAGVDSDAANLAGPAADPRVFEARRAIGRAWIYSNIQQSARDWCENPDCQRRHFKTADGARWHKRGIENALADLLPDDDDQHPYVVLTRWHMMLAEDYGHTLPEQMTIADSGAYLIRNLGRMAQDPGQDFPLFRREMRTCRDFMEAVIRNSPSRERGAPCPDCSKVGRVVRLQRDYGHWCTREDCAKLHYLDDSGDRWVCPHDSDHWMTPEGYAQWLKDRATQPRASA